MPSDERRIHICIGLEHHYEEMKSFALLPEGKEADWWNVTKAAQPNDTVLIYLNDPVSAFIASATIGRISECPDDLSQWKDKPCAWLVDVMMLPEIVTRKQAQERFPDWRYLNRPTAACIPNDTTSSEMVDRLLDFLQLGSPLPERYSNPTDIEGLKVEYTSFTRTRSRRLRDLAFNESNGICCVCKQDFTKLLDGNGVRVLQVHHRQQLSSVDTPSVTSLNDLAVVCANCHLLLHLDPKRALAVEALQEMLQAT